MDNTREKLIEVQNLSGLGEKFERQLAIQKQFAEKMKLIDLLTDRIPGIDNELRYVDDERVERLADHLIANGVTLDNQVSSSKWIPVTERLPEDDLVKDSKVKLIKVLVFYKNSMGVPVVRTQIRQKGYRYHRDEWGWVKYEPITHWMPLPEPPKGD